MGLSMSPSWIRYANQGATRNLPLAPQMYEALGFLPELGVQMEVFSGGQPAKGSGKPRVGSTRHDHGNAADVFFYKDGRRLDWANPDDLPLFQEIVRRGRANGITGFGAGEGYMQPGSMHIGFGGEAVWGAGGKGANAPDWLRSAYYGADAPSAPSQTVSTNSPQGLLPSMQQEAPQMQREKVGGLLGRLFPNMEADRADEIRLGLQGLLHNPNEAKVGAIQARMGERADNRKTQAAAAQAQQQANRTIAVMRQQGAPDYLIAAAEAGQVGPAFNEFLKLRDQGPEKPNWQWNGDIGQYVDMNDPTSTYTPQVGAPKVDVEGESALRKEYTGRTDVKAFKQQADAFARIRSAAEQPDAAGDLALIFNYMKLLDPGSTVREGEFATAQNAAGVEGRIVSLYNSVINGERLNEAQRAEFVNRAGRIYEGARSQNAQTEGQFREMASDYGLDPQRAVPDLSYQSPYAPQSATRPTTRNQQSGDSFAVLDMARRAKTMLSPMDQEMFADLIRRNAPLETLQDFLDTRGKR